MCLRPPPWHQPHHAVVHQPPARAETHASTAPYSAVPSVAMLVGGCRRVTARSRLIPRVVASLPHRVPTACRGIVSHYMQDVTAASPAVVAHYDRAVHSYLSLSASPTDDLDAAVSLDADFIAGHLLTAWMFALSTGFTAEYPPLATAWSQAAKLLSQQRGNARERALGLALQCWLQGHQARAVAVLEGWLLGHPHDPVVVRLLHDMYFFMGDAINLRDCVARVLPQWDVSMPGYSKLLGMLAFGLEENNQYAAAEEQGMMAVGMDANDPWALHAVTHVYEMTSRMDEGRRLLAEHRELWEKAVLLDHHLHWHLCLFDLEDGEYRNAVSRYDNAMTGENRIPVLNVVDTTALFWRMELVKSEVSAPSSTGPRPSDPVSAQYLQFCGTWDDAAGRAVYAPPFAKAPTRWTELHSRWGPHANQTLLAFNCIHAAMAAVAAGDDKGADALVDGMGKVAPTLSLAQVIRGAEDAGVAAVAWSHQAGVGLATSPTGVLGYSDNCDQYAIIAKVASVMSRGMVAFWRGDYGQAVADLLATRPQWPLIGGSAAQRDVFALTLIHAALRHGQLTLARALLAQRVTMRFASPQSWYLYGSCLSALGDHQGAVDARNRAYALGLGQGGPAY